MQDQIKKIIQQSIDTKVALLQNEEMLSKISHATNIITQALQEGNKILFCGNGGSAADAQHLAAEFSGRFYHDRKALPAEALHTNTSYLTAVANDYGYEFVYSRLLEGVGKEGDVLVGISTSGNSKNIIKAYEKAKEMNIKIISMTGQGGGKMASFTDLLLDMPSTDTPRIQECHIMVGHIICQLVEEKYFNL